ncbi:hypothetical protein HMPREF1862_01131 [Varibaculum cambriense]|uniref:Uncharacterized protein n=1 Tax=Varibaculum cambriense TaxID=184870 RepID=A0AB34WYR3_9ACTO|nr:hypothetical protein HMPREF1862_01131 [Varibaculum cambriense]
MKRLWEGKDTDSWGAGLRENGTRSPTSENIPLEQVKITKLSF